MKSQLNLGCNNNKYFNQGTSRKKKNEIQIFSVIFIQMNIKKGQILKFAISLPAFIFFFFTKQQFNVSNY